MYRTAVTLAALVILAGCTRSSPEPAATVPPATATVAYITPTATPVPPPTPTATPEPEPTPAIRTKTNGVPMAGTFKLLSLEENIVWADVIARARFRSVASVVEQVDIPSGDDYYAPALVFTFDVLEYLKGTGGTQVLAVAYAYDDEYMVQTEEAAREFLPSLLASRDTRWDSREAVVFMAKTSRMPSTVNEANRYFMGFTHFLGPHDGYTVASNHYRVWLPDANNNPTPPSGSRSVTEQRFLLSDPAAAGTSAATRGAGGAGGSSETITVSELRTKVGGITAEVAAGDGSDAYRRCVEHKYYYGRVASEGRLWHHGADVTMRSGTPGGYVLDSYDFGLGLNPDTYGRYWLSGSDQDLFRVQTHSPRPNTPDTFLYVVDMVAERPLPAGHYSFTAHQLYANRALCGLMTDAERETGGAFNVTVTAAGGTAAEALFDPVTLDGVTATSTARLFVAPGSPGTTAIGAIKWKAGTLSVELTPASSFAGHHLDFIAIDGTLAETAAVDDATCTGDTLSWAVADSPWEAGDKMMVRLYRVVSSTCTVTEGAMKPGACYQDPVFAGAP